MTGTIERRVTGLVLAPLALVERTKGFKRRLLLLGYALIGCVVALLLWRAASLNGLPDVGEPFDAKAFEGYRVPEDEDAYTIYRRAAARIRGEKAPGLDYSRLWATVRSGKLDAHQGEWLDGHQEVLEEWRRGTERTRAMPVPPGNWDFDRIGDRGTDTPTTLAWMALLEGIRREEAGDTAGAWRWYGAVLRFSRHVGTHAPLDHRITGEIFLDAVGDRLVRLAADPKTDAATLRRALADLKVVDAMTPPVSDAIKGEYLLAQSVIDHPDRWIRFQDVQFPLLSQNPRLFHFYLWFRREPERSRRVYRILFAHWLAHADDPPGTRPKMSETRVHGNESYPDFPYYAPKGLRDAAHPLSSEEMYEWFRSMVYMQSFGPGMRHTVPQLDVEAKRRDVLKLLTAEALYRREHGKDSAAPEDLIKAGYLDRLPAGYESKPAEKDIDAD